MFTLINYIHSYCTAIVSIVLMFEHYYYFSHQEIQPNAAPSDHLMMVLCSVLNYYVNNTPQLQLCTCCKNSWYIPGILVVCVLTVIIVSCMGLMFILYCICSLCSFICHCNREVSNTSMGDLQLHFWSYWFRLQLAIPYRPGNTLESYGSKAVSLITQITPLLE